ncbi:MAG: polyprenyl synthetase family protein [Desulfotomaculaceae bacterium]|nr:polyprenyl synthetase family protein [Desulfotomaculaceae bacterium]
MLSHIIEEIARDLAWVNNLIEDHLKIKAGYLGAFANLDMSPINQDIRPALVILSSRIYGNVPEKAVVLASVFQFIYMAANVQRSVSESDTETFGMPEDPNLGSQFPVLVGDYLYGKFFTLLSEADMLNLLRPIAEIICHIHEGGIMKQKLKLQTSPSKALGDAIQKESAELFGGCCSLGALLAGAPAADQKAMKRFGESLGMAYGLLEEGVKVEHITSYLLEAKEALSLIPCKPERLWLEKLVCNLSGQGLATCRMVI